ncbi:hypothetical protein CTKZ_30510 [Cellulomonas algicola]|uniref:Protein kinase domain-containing protein n=2 Tax=Cellulomonas algicola TaxID=2071633 RepID=A0A401V3J6_9CELL|nr:hypothetical protein CTKZ_30510 [Cellulomonas algicola]
MDEPHARRAVHGSMPGMETFLVPADVRALVDGSAFRVVGAAGPDGSGWLAAATDGSDRRLEVHVVATVLDDLTAARVERLRHVRHDHLPVLHDVVEIGPGRTALVVEHVAGPTLAELRSQRAPLSDGEAATVAIPVASALAALHDAGLAHGGVSPATVVVRPDGRPALVDLRGVLAGSGTPDGDVRRLVASVLAQVPDADVHLLAGPHDGSLRDALEDLLTSGDVSAARLVDRCFAVVTPEPVRVPDAGARAALDLVRTGASAAADLRRPRRAPRRAPRALVVGVVATGVVVVGGLALGTAGLRSSAGDERAAGAPPAASSAASARTAPPSETEVDAQGVADGTGEPARTTDVAEAAAELTQLRAQHVAAGDAARLVDVEVPDGPAHRADLRLVEALAGDRVEGLAVDVQQTSVVAGGDSAGGPTPGAEAAVRVTSAMSGYTRVDASGASTAVPAASPRTVVLTLRWTADGWRVWDVADA